MVYSFSWRVPAAAGLLCILAAGAFTVSEISRSGDQTTGCNTNLTASDASLAILAVGTGDMHYTLLHLGRKVCIVVANVVAPGSEASQLPAIKPAPTVGPGASGTDASARTPGIYPRTGTVAHPSDAPTAANRPPEVNLALFINGVKTPVVQSAWARSAPQTVVFDLKTSYDASTADALSWREIMGGIANGGTREVEIGVGFADAKWPASQGPGAARWKAIFSIFDVNAAYLATLGLMSCVVSLCIAARYTGILRDGGPGSTFSLGRVLMAFWLFITVAGFVFIWAVTGQYSNVITTSTFTLLGIAGATGFVSQAVDTRDVAADAPRVPGSGFLDDLFSDSSGPQLHRIQVVVWTLVLGAIFIWNIITHLRMTDFDSNLLILVGIVGGVYAGLKTQEASSKS